MELEVFARLAETSTDWLGRLQKGSGCGGWELRIAASLAAALREKAERGREGGREGWRD